MFGRCMIARRWKDAIMAANSDNRAVAKSGKMRIVCDRSFLWSICTQITI